jgi:hypothetical protein
MASSLTLVTPSVGAEDKYRYKYLIAIAVTLAAVLELVDTSIVNVAIPHMMGNLGATLDEISWVSTGYIIANVVVIPISGWLSGYFGRKRYITGSILLFVAASFFCGSAHSLGLLVFWRVVQGIGGGALLSTAQATLFEAFPPHEIGIGQAMFARRRHGRPDDRTDVRQLDRRQLRLAVDFLHQHPARHPRCHPRRWPTSTTPSISSAPGRSTIKAFCC